MEVENPFAPPVPQRSSSRMIPIPRSPRTPLVRPTPLSTILPPTPVQTPRELKTTSVVSCAGSSIILENDPSPTPAEASPEELASPTPSTILTDILNTGWAPPPVTLPVTPQPSPSPETDRNRESPISDASTLVKKKTTMRTIMDGIAKIVEKKRASRVGFHTLDDENKDQKKRLGISEILRNVKGKGVKGSGKIEISRNGDKVALDTVSSRK